jgi:exodeoxyribonuclease V alpha subunit
MNNIVEFKCKIQRLVFSQENYKIYGVEVDVEKYPFLQLNEYGNVTIVGNIHVLTIGNQYSVTAIPKTSKRGLSYEVKNIKMDKPTSKEDTVNFLSEILTSRQCNILLTAYPNIIELIEEDRTDEIDFTSLHGIKEHTFTRIEQKIKENLIYADLIAELGGQIEFNVIKKLFDEFTSMEMVKRKLKTEGYRCLMNLSRIGFKRADDIMINIYRSCLEKLSEDKVPPIMFDYNLIESPQRCEAVVRHILETNENNDGNTKMKISAVLNDCEQLTPECKQHFNTVINYQDMFYHDEEYIALVETFNAEKFIADRLSEGLLYKNKWDYNTEKFKTIGENIELTDQQFSVLDLICKENIVLLIGNAGCGKSSSAQAIINMAKDNGITYRLMSPTAKAAKVLKEYTKEETSTIHRALGLGMERNNDSNDELVEELIIVDEVSMLDVRLAKTLISSINFTRTKLLLIGDDSQLPSIGAGNLLHDLIQCNIIPTVKLTQVFRNSGGVLKASIYIRNQQIYLQDNGQIQYIGDDNGYCFIPVAQEYCVGQVVNGYKTLLENGYKPEEIMVLSAYNKGDYGTIAINKLLQPLANPLGVKGDGIKVFDADFYINDMVMQTVNNYHAVKHQDFNKASESKIELWDDDYYGLGIYDDEDTSEEVFIANGETGIIRNIIKEKEGKYKVIIDFDGVSVEYDNEDMKNIRHAYCISTHKSQGSNARIVILITPKAHTYMLNSNLLYVGDTRAREKVFHIGDVTTINRAIKKKIDYNRSTYLKELLIN